jgi:hypothetical protein
MSKEPVLYNRSLDKIRSHIEDELAAQKWRGQTGGAGQALIHLFGHFADVIINRLNRVPEQHLRAFLNEAEIDSLPARPASAELTFVPAADGAIAITVPAGMQVATRPADTEVEIIFETERDLVVIPTAIERSIVVDPLMWSDRTPEMRGEKEAPFVIFQGEIERERVLYVGHESLLTFPDAASRQNAIVTLYFDLERVADPDTDGNWRLEWSYWDGIAWQNLSKVGAKVEDQTHHLRTSGKVIFSSLPELQKSVVDGEESVWLQCRLLDGTGRAHLPKVADLLIERTITIQNLEEADGAALLQSRPGLPGADGNIREHLFYIGHDELFSFADPNSRRRAVITLVPVFEQVGVAPLPPALPWKLQLLYWNGVQWIDLEEAGALIVDETRQLCRLGVIRISQLPDLCQTTVDETEKVWLLARLVAAPLHALDSAALPVLTGVAIHRKIQPKAAVVDTLLAAVQSGVAFTPLEVEGPFLPLGPIPMELDTFYLQIDEAFTKPGARVTLEFLLEGLPAEITDFTELDRLLIEWDYFSSDGWVLLGRSIRGCAAIVAYNFPSVGLSNPTIYTSPLTRTKVIEFVAPPGFSEAHLRGPRRNGKIITDIYTGIRYVQFPLPKECEQLPPEYLLTGCYLAERLNFRDRTCAFTANGTAIVEFDIPEPGEAPLFAPVEIAGRLGYWVRARVEEGSYNVPQQADVSLVQRLTLQPAQYLPPITYAPTVEQFNVTYRGYHARDDLQRVPRCRSRVDALWRNHAAPPDEWRPFEPFTAPAHVQAEPALYVGFNPLDMTGTRVAFPSNKWIQMRIEVDEYDQTSEFRLLWQYWNGRTWSSLRVIDETLSLRLPGYVSFFGPEDHKQSTEFGTTAFWLRVLPEPAPAGGAKVRALPAIRVRTLLLNTVPAVNGGAIVGELLGFSNGEPNQRFTLTHRSILPDILLEVREPEVHSESEHLALAQAGALTAPLEDDPNLPDHEEWVAWQPVSSFYGCGPDSRCYLFDPIQGEIRFGDGKHGKIPPPGKSNIRVRRYRVHNGAAGNLPRAALAVLRNPSGALSDIQGVTNFALAVGGVDAELVDQTKRRGPQSLKHRQQPVMAEDYQWITLEADNVARAYCLPARDPLGARQPGWVTVVVVPQSTESKPLPAPATLRQIRNRLEGIALANLKQFDAVEPGESHLRQNRDLDQIHVVGPQYMEVQIRGEVVPLEPEKGDDVRLAVLRRLAEFMHPLTGGPERQGWEPGRDVHISEVAAEIESVPGVDHLEELSLDLAGIQQRSLVLADVRRACIEMPAGSLVTTFDGRIKMVLAKTWRKNEVAQSLMVYGFMLGDPVTILTSEGSILAADQTIAQVEGIDRTIRFETPVPWLIIDGKEQLFVKGPHTRLAVERYLRASTDDENAPVAGVVVRGVQPGDDGFAVDDVVTILTAEGLSLAFDLVIAEIDPAHNRICFQQTIPWPQTDARLILRGTHTSVAIKERLFSPEKDDQGNPLLTGVVLRGYEPDERPLLAGDQVRLVHADGAPVTADVKVSAVERFDNAIYFAQGIPLEKVWSAQPRELILQGKQTRMLVEQGKVVTDEQGRTLLTGVVVRGFKSGDLLSVVHRDQPRRRIDFLPVEEIRVIESLTRIYVPDDHLVFSGQHVISLTSGVKDVDSITQPR